MKSPRLILGGFAAGFIVVAALAETPKEARVTQIIREVKILPADADERDALVDDKVAEDTGVRTGGDSRSELTFADLTITRLGANTIFSFNKAGRTVNLDSGSVLLRVPKNSGGGTIRNNVVTVAITGTTVILETTPDGGSRLITLEGEARLSFTNNPKQVERVRAAQMLDVPAGATTLPKPVNINLNEFMRTHPLIVDFQPLPSLPLINAVAKRQPAPPQTRPPSAPPSGPVVGPSPTPRTKPPPGGPGKQPPTVPTPRPITDPSPSPTPRATATPRPTPTPKPTPPKPKPTPTPQPSPTPERPPKPSPTPTPKIKKPPVLTTKPPVMTTNPTPSGSPVILKTVPSQSNTQSSGTVRRYQNSAKKPTPAPGPR